MTEAEEIELAGTIRGRATELGWEQESFCRAQQELALWLLAELTADSPRPEVWQLARDFSRLSGWLCPACLSAGKYFCHCCNDE